ncbi:MAG: CAP domain-containing protein [Bauldia sp.]|nr:CAP domain-containing protein [Bauldia sp.]
MPFRLAAPALLAALFALAACMGPRVEVDPTRAPASGPVAVDAATAARMVSAIRAQHGLGPVTVDPALNRLAQQQANAMAAAGIVSHDVLARFPVRMGRAYTSAAENLGAGYLSLEDGIRAWSASPDHLRNLLRPDMERLGIASAYSAASPYRNFFAMILAGPPAE